MDASSQTGLLETRESACARGRHFEGTTVRGNVTVAVFLAILSVALSSTVNFPGRLRDSWNCTGAVGELTGTSLLMAPSNGLAMVGWPLSSRTRHSTVRSGWVLVLSRLKPTTP